MEKSKWLSSFYYACLCFMLHIELVNTRIFSYKDDEHDYLQVYDRAKMKNSNDAHERFKRSYTKYTSSYRKSSPFYKDKNISSHHIFTEDSNNVAFVFWKHAKTSVIFILTCQSANTTNYNKHSNKGCKSNSKFYRSDDHGKSFNPITKGIEGAHLHSIYLSPINKQFIVLTDYKNKTLYLTSDEGKSFKKYNVPFQPTYIYFHPVSEKYIAAYDNTAGGKNSLYLSENRGATWVLVSHKVRNYFWARPKHDKNDKIIYIEKETDRKIDSKTATSHLYSSQPPYKVIKLDYDEHLLPFSVYVGEAFIIVQRLYDRKLYVSGGKKSQNFIMASFDKLDKHHEMQVVVSDDNDEILLALVHINLISSLYLSDHEGKKFRLRQTNIETEPITSQVVPPKMDLYVVKGVLGTYIVNKKINKEGRLTGNKNSIITFDKGRTWRPIKVDNVHVKGGKLNTRCRKMKCDLKLYLKIEPGFSDFTAPIISKENAPGIIIAQGNIGGVYSVLKYYVFISKDGGYTWQQQLNPTNGFVILDHGGLIAATPLKYTSGAASAEVKYSTNYGETWSPIHLTQLYSRIAAIITESTASLLVMNVFGFLYPDKQGGTKGNTWIVWQFNFTKILNKSCKNNDFEIWKHNNNECVMGERTSNLRRIQYRKCITGPRFDNKFSRTSCPCTYKDYACEESFYRKKKDNHTECVPINPRHHPIKVCERQHIYLKSAGYRKLYGNKCSGGVSEKLQKEIVNCTIEKPGIMQITVQSSIIGINKPLLFKIIQVEGFYNASYTWNFGDSTVKSGSYSEMKTIIHRFDKAGTYNISLRASNKKGSSSVNITVSVIENIQLNAHIIYDHPLLINIPKLFSLQTFAPNGTLVPVRHLPLTKIMWSFDGVYVGDDHSVVKEYTFKKSGITNVEVQVMNSVSFEVYRERISVYQDAIVVDVTFSKELDNYNLKTKQWIIDFETRYRIYLDKVFQFEKDGIADRIHVRGKPVIPTVVSIIVYDTVDSKNAINSASNIAERIRKNIVKNHPLVKGYEDKNIRAIGASMSTFSKHKSTSDKPKKYAWVYIIVAMLIIAAVITLIAYYRYRYKGIISCVFINDNLGKQLIDDDEVDMEPEPPEAYNHL